MKSQKILIASFFIFSVLSCKKNVGKQHHPSAPAVEDSATRHMAALIKEVAVALESVYANDTACREVNAAIYSGYYRDERVLLDDLLFPGESPLYQSENFKKLQVDTGIFRRSFCQIIVKEKLPMLQELITRPIPKKPLLGRGMVVSESQIPDTKTKIAIYFPYSENFRSTTSGLAAPNGKIAAMSKPSIVAADRDADSGPGRAPYYCLNGGDNVCYRDVTVSDSYAESKPTHIITVGADPSVSGLEDLPPAQALSRIYHGWSRLTKQLDKLISVTGNGGGSEIKVCRINGYLRMSSQQIESFDGDIVTLQYTRGEIRRKDWKRVYSIWDPNWNYQNTEQVYAVYEEDTKGEKTFTGNLKTTVTLPGKANVKADGDIGFKVTVQTQDEIITQRNIDRKSFFGLARNNQGWGFRQDASDFLSGTADWPIYDGGTIWSYTMPYQVY